MRPEGIHTSHTVLSLTNTHTNNPFPKLEKEKVKKRAKRYPSYDHIRGEYTTLNNTHLPHVKMDGKDTLTNIYSYYFCESSLIRTNLHKNKHYTKQHATGSYHHREVPVQRLTSAHHATALGRNSNVPVQILMPRTGQRSKSLNTSTNKITNSIYFSKSMKRTETTQNPTEAEAMEEAD